MDRKKPVAVEIFKLAKRGETLPAKLEELVPLSFIGQTAVSFYRQKIKLMDQLKMTEEQRKEAIRILKGSVQIDRASGWPRCSPP